MKLNSSPRGAPSPRRRSASGERPDSPRISLPRAPETLAGDNKKILRCAGSRRNAEGIRFASVAGTWPTSFILLPCIWDYVPRPYRFAKCARHGRRPLQLGSLVRSHFSENKENRESEQTSERCQCRAVLALHLVGVGAERSSTAMPVILW
jgi:hypothetical protein